MLIGLVAECPLVSNPKDCPLHERLKLPMDEQVKWVNSRPDNKCQQICLILCECFTKKEENHHVVQN